MQLRDRADSEIKELDRQISALEERKFYIEGQLAQMKPNTPLISASGERVLDSEERLKTLKAQFASQSGVYSSDHPDIVKMRREIEALQKATGGGTDPQERSKQLTRLRADLATTRDKYSDDHPDVVKAEKIHRRVGSGTTHGGSVNAAGCKARESCVYRVSGTARINSSLNSESSRSKRAALQSKVASYDQRLEQTPQVEREYLELTRDHEASLMRYREIRAKQMQAEHRSRTGKGSKGGAFFAHRSTSATGKGRAVLIVAPFCCWG